MRKIIYTAAMLLSSHICTAKPNEDLVKANYLYNHLAYYEAIDYYRRSVNVQGDPLAMAHLADCYRLTKNYEQANNWYGKAVALNGCPPDAWLHYGQTLMNTGDYAQALLMLRKYAESNPADRRVQDLLASCEKIDQMKRQIPAGSIQFLSLNTDRSEFGPALRRNELFFTSDTVTKGTAKKDNWTGQPFYKIYSTTCSSNDQCNGLKELKGKTDTRYHDGPASFSADGNMMFLTRTSYQQKFIAKNPLPDNNDIVHLQIIIASDYDEGTGKYKKLVPFKYNNQNYSVAHAAVSKDGNTLIFTSDMPGGEGGADLYICRKDDRGDWDMPVNAGKDINTEGDELFPYLDKDSTLYFASNGHVGYGGLDIYRSTWNKVTNSYSGPENMGMPLNSSYDDMSLVMNDAGNAGYFASDRPAKRKGDNIYSFSPQSIYLQVTGIDSMTGKPLPGVLLNLRSSADTAGYTGDGNGHIATRLYPQQYYAGTVSAFDYQPKDIALNTMNITRRNDTIHMVVKLKPNSRYNYNVVVYDEETRRPVEDPVIVFHKVGARIADTAKVATGQPYTTPIEPGSTYQVFAMKDNYYGNEKMVSTEGLNYSSGNVNIRDTLFMKRLHVGGSYNINDIYYDFNKANIREDAKSSLERLITVLQQYPAMHIQVNSHTDCRGSDSYNLKLSNARAHSVIMYLQERGIRLSRLQYKGYGESMPVHKCASCNECTEADHQANRRTEFTITSM